VRYRSAAAIWSGNPNPHLITQVADLAPVPQWTWAAAKGPTRSGSPGGAGRSVVSTWGTADVISAFVAPALSGPTDTSRGQAFARHPSIKEEHHIASEDGLSA